MAAIRKWCRGFSEVVVVTPRTGSAAVRRAIGGEVRLEVCPDYRDDYLGQQVTKLYADDFTAADLICHVDSDVVFTRPVSPPDLLAGGRPWIVRRAVADLGRHRPWLASTESFLGRPIAYDFIQRPPFTYPRWLYPEVRALSLERHGIPLDRYVMRCPARGFSEFNVLGAHAYTTHRTSFTWYDAHTLEEAPRLCGWYWSRAGIDAGLRRELELIVSELL
ncbi:hypothetical protein AR457_38500 [Streptomyces agglomeratus]|uniref:hypothetical protein n=1 Tax=Streptomyces agglomeratus TaxID=285458 RepID=UPI0008545C71|nr:hypothetical protein [Streptomyces agglomeratus]OEJ23078.1 hypothetical protein AR457_38500 [Streptomyces agglomeratus]